MDTKDIYKLMGKTSEQVKLAYIAFMGDKDATTKQIKDAENSNYAKIGTKQIVSEIVQKLYSKDCIFDVRTSESVQNVSDELSTIIEETANNPKEQKELKNIRSYINKYKEFLTYCEQLADMAKHKQPYSFTEDTDNPFINEEKFLKMVSLLNRKKNIILEGAPGVGKTFLARKIAYQLMGEVRDENIEMVQFHQSYSYEDFVQGIRPSDNGGFEVRNGIFYNFCQKARRSDEPFVFIIDEINRGNLSKIFGEMMMLIEADKRSKKYAIKLTYSEEDDDRFYVPSNVYIIGCMNTADRSLAIVDYALRRRFAFCKIAPEFNEVFQAFLSEKIGKQNVENIVKRLNRVNDMILSTPALGSGLEIGHSYFCHAEGITNFDEWWAELCEYELFPYIQEICFDDEDLCRELCNILR